MTRVGSQRHRRGEGEVSLTTDYFRYVLPTSVHTCNYKKRLLRGDGITKKFRLNRLLYRSIVISVLCICSFCGDLFNSVVS
jgi:hypothetical protein